MTLSQSSSANQTYLQKEVEHLDAALVRSGKNTTDLRRQFKQAKSRCTMLEKPITDITDNNRQLKQKLNQAYSRCTKLEQYSTKLELYVLLLKRAASDSGSSDITMLDRPQD